MTLLDRLAHRLKLRDFRLLEVVVRSGSMARAAVQLNMSQPAVSKAVAELEHMLGVQLLDRSRHGVEPTVYGLALIKTGATIFDELRQGVSEIEFLTDPTVGEVRVAASEPMAAGLLPLIIGRIAEQFPRIAIHMVQSPITSLQQGRPQYAALRERQVDLVLGPIVVPKGDDSVVVEQLFEDPLVVAVGAVSPLANRRSMGLADLINERWCLPPADSTVGARCIAAFQACDVEPPPVIVSVQSIQLQAGLLATSGFATMLPGSLIRFSGNRLGIKVLPIVLQVPATKTGIITLKHRTQNSVAKLFTQIAKEVAA